MPPKLVVCPECACHAKLHETHCPSCGTKLRGPGAWMAPAAAVVAMGLTAVNCGDDETETSGTSTRNVSQNSTIVVSGYTHGSTITVGEGGSAGQSQGGAGGDAGGQGGAGGK